MILNKKTGFEIVRFPVKILDFRGIVFYDTSLYPKVSNFNLPEGEYKIISGLIKELKNPLKYPLKITGKVERYRKWPTYFTIKISDNPNKASIDWVFKEIQFDRNLVKNWSLPKLMFLYYHEIGHARYNTEKKVDRFAYNCMISEGYNPEQIAESIIEGLSDKQEERISDGYFSTMTVNNYEEN